MNMKVNVASVQAHRRNQPLETVTEIILQRGEPHINVRRSV